MPMPTTGESREDFLERGMSDAEATRDFPDEEQRFAFLMSQWEEYGPHGAEKADTRWTCKIEKVDEEQRLAYGWFSVIEVEGQPVVDRQGDVIVESEMVRFYHRFMQDSRAGKVMHRGRRTADVVELMCFTKDLQKALGIDLGRVGVFGAMKIRDDAAWEGVKSGRLRAFSFGGSGDRKESDG